MFSELPSTARQNGGDETGIKNELVLDQLSKIINEYLENNPRISLNGLSKRCQVSEPTIRRIAKKQVKTVPTVSTILDLLTTISRNQDVKTLITQFSGPVGDHIKEALPHLDDQKPEYSKFLNDYLKDPLKYLIFKLTLNKSGVSPERIKELFGDHGLRELEGMLQVDIVEKRKGRYYSICKSFTGSYENFIEHFRASAGFIKTHKVVAQNPLGPLFVNASESVSEETYKEIAKVQRAAFKKISQLINKDDSEGSIPLMYLCALDTLDVESAFDIANRGDSPL